MKNNQYIALANKQFKHSCFAFVTYLLLFVIILIANDFTIKFPNVLSPMALYFVSLGLCLSWVGSIIFWTIKVVFYSVCTNKNTPDSTKDTISKVDEASKEYLNGVFNLIKKAKEIKK